MHRYSIDLAQLKYWLFVLLAMFVYVPLVHHRWRLWTAAALNLLFLKLYLTIPQLASVICGLVAVFALIQFVAKSHFRTAACILLIGPTVSLFFLYKFPALGFLDRKHIVLSVLATLSYSYVTLRILDMFRTVSMSDCRPPSFPETVNYLIPFHMLAAGPIQAYSEYLEQPALPASLTPVQTLQAVERIGLGVVKKYVFAMLLQRLFMSKFSNPGWYIFFEMQIFYIWVYLDFSGLSDIAKGIGILLGITTPENFNRPYFARNMIDFWERWHISLSQFIRRNIFIPIQLVLMRRTSGTHPLMCACAAMTVSFLLCGLWHQGTWRYLIWGGIHAFGVIATNIYRDRLTRRLGSKGVNAYLANPWIRIVSTIVTFEFVAFSLALIEFPF